MSVAINFRATGNWSSPYQADAIAYYLNPIKWVGGGSLCPPHQLVTTKFFDIPAALINVTLEHLEWERALFNIQLVYKATLTFTIGIQIMSGSLF